MSNGYTWTQQWGSAWIRLRPETETYLLLIDENSNYSRTFLIRLQKSCLKIRCNLSKSAETNLKFQITFYTVGSTFKSF